MIDAMLMLSLIVAFTGLFFWVLFEKGCLPALLVLFAPLVPIIIIVLVLAFKSFYNIHGISGVIFLIFALCIVATPIVFVIGIFIDVEHGIDIFERKPRKKPEPHKDNTFICDQIGHQYEYKFHPTHPTNRCKRCGKE